MTLIGNCFKELLSYFQWFEFVPRFRFCFTNLCGSMFIVRDDECSRQSLFYLKDFQSNFFYEWTHSYPYFSFSIVAMFTKDYVFVYSIIVFFSDFFIKYEEGLFGWTLSFFILIFGRGESLFVGIHFDIACVQICRIVLFVQT